MTQDPGSYSFVQNALPPLESGDLAFAVQQNLTIGGVTERISATASFYVSGPRTGLDPSAIDSRFPPPGGQGDYGDVLPHVVLVDQTLPWQRPCWADPTSPGVNQAPWLALLVFDEGDPPPTVQNVTLADLQQPPDGVYHPAFALEGAESGSDPVSVIDVPAALFDTIAPSFADVGWTAHVRIPPGTDAGVAVVLGNRFPSPGRQSFVHLVSIEGFGPVLPPDADRGSGLPADAAYAGVRLVTLANWSFSTVGEAQTFAAAVQALDASQAGMQLPASADGGSADAAVLAAFGNGYTALDHGLRDGTATVSWYRGPLLPVSVPPYALPAATVADDLLRYDPTTGMFDATYAAAWQLGQLLALRDSTFSNSLYRLKTGLAQTAASGAAAARLDLALGSAAGSAPRSGRKADRIADVLRRVVGPAAASLGSGRGGSGRNEAPRRIGLAPEDLRRALRSAPPAAASDPDLATVLGWMQRLRALTGVPLNYLVPDVGMLPVEALRIFQVDMVWMSALASGALSVGGPTPDALQTQIDGAVSDAGLAGPLTGFMLRSSIVGTWPNLTASAYDADGDVLPVTTSALSSSLMLGLVQGTLVRLDLMQPAQTLHFGADAADAPISVNLRYAAASQNVAAGSSTGASQTANLRTTSWQPAAGSPSVPTTGGGTVQFDDFASAIAASVWPPGNPDGTLTSAELGLQFVQEGEAVSFEMRTAGTDGTS